MAFSKKKKKGKKSSDKESEDVSEDQNKASPLGLPPLEEEVVSKEKKEKKLKKKEKKPSAAQTISPVITIEIEKLNSRMEALSQMRGMFNERLSTISEQIGELRNMVVSQEQEFSELEVKSARTNEVMSQLEPGKILKEISKLDMRIEAITGKIESNEAVNSMIMKELKEQRSKMALFKGVEDTIKLNQEVREELTTIKKVESQVEMHSNKVESMFIQVQKRFNDFEKFKEMAEDLDAAYKEQIQEFDTMKVRFADLVKTEDIKAVKEELSGVMDSFGKRLLSIEGIAGSINELVTAKKFSEFKDQNLKVLKEHQKAIAKAQEMRQLLDGLIEEKKTATALPAMDKLNEIFVSSGDINQLQEEIIKMKSIMTYGFKRVQQMESKMFIEKETYEMIRQMISKYLEKGYTKGQIVEAFEMQGWPRPLIKSYIGQ
ncbi:MAG: hypothetical protein U9R34_02075 [Nanoarchaeota archaeon]|nr:hypothetical protein [Nanoarchaeota archaeon]